MHPIGEAPDQDNSWEDEEFDGEDYWTVGSLQAVHQPPREVPTPIRNRWEVIAPDSDDEYEPNDEPAGPMTKNAINCPLPTSTAQSKRGKNMSIVHSTSNSINNSTYSPIIGCMLSCDEISYNSTISTCKKDQQCSQNYRIAARQDVRSSDLKPPGAKTCAPSGAHLELKDGKGALAAHGAQASTHSKPKDMKGVLTAAETMDLKPKNVKEMLGAQNTIEYTESEAEHDALDPRDSSGEAWTGTDGSVRLPMTPISPRAAGVSGQTAGPGGTTSIEHLSGNRIDCGAFEVDAMADDKDDDFNGTLNVSAQDKTTGKPNEMLEEMVQGLKLTLINGCCAPRSKRAGAKSCTPPVDSGLTTPVHNCDAPCMLKPSSQMLHQDPFLWTPITPKVLAGGTTTHPCEIALGSLSSRDGVESSWGASLQQQPDCRPAMNADSAHVPSSYSVDEGEERKEEGEDQQNAEAELSHNF